MGQGELVPLAKPAFPTLEDERQSASPSDFRDGHERSDLTQEQVQLP